MKKLLPILLFFVLTMLLPSHIKGQVGITIKQKREAFDAHSMHQFLPSLNRKYSEVYNHKTLIKQDNLVKPKTPLPISKSLMSSYHHFSVDRMPFFCKIEYKMGLNQKLPLKFRLGDVRYVDELEGK